MLWCHSSFKILVCTFGIFNFQLQSFKFINPSRTPINAPSTPPGGLQDLLPPFPLRMIIVGINPSQQAWKQGHYYANPTNKMWAILKSTEIAPSDHIRGACDDHLMPHASGVGFTDLGLGVPETQSSRLKPSDFAAWRPLFFNRLANHAKQAGQAPRIIAFAGKKQFMELFSKISKKRKAISTHTREDTIISAPTTTTTAIQLQDACPSQIHYGKQFVLPTCWPLPVKETDVYVVPSTSGAAALSHADRYGPWQELSAQFHQIPWPLNK